MQYRHTASFVFFFFLFLPSLFDPALSGALSLPLVFVLCYEGGYLRERVRELERPALDLRSLRALAAEHMREDHAFSEIVPT